MQKYNAQNGRKITQIHPDTNALFNSYRWPGNVRELENAIERSVVLSDRNATTLTPDLLPEIILSSSPVP